MERLLQRSAWSSDLDYEQGYNQLVEVMACMSNRCFDALIESNNQLYRLLDTTMNGAVYIEDSLAGVAIVTPPIPLAPASVSRSIHSRLERLEYLLDNTYNGAIHAPDFANPVGTRQQLADLLIAMQATESIDSEQLAELAQIVLALV